MKNLNLFIEALNLINLNHEKMKYFLTDFRLSKNEKVILSAWLDYSSHKIEKICANTNKLMDFDCKGDLILKSQKDIFQGLILKNNNDYLNAIKLFKSSLLLMEDTNLTYQKFVAVKNLFECYKEISSREGMTLALTIFQELECDSLDFKINYYKCFYYYQINFGQGKLAQKILGELNKLSASL